MTEAEELRAVSINEIEGLARSGFDAVREFLAGGTERAVQARETVKLLSVASRRRATDANQVTNLIVLARTLGKTGPDLESLWERMIERQMLPGIPDRRGDAD